jgi:hypothetical protein
VPAPSSVTEFDRQVHALVAAGYAALTGRSDDEFRAAVAPLAGAVPPAEPKSEDGIAFVVVVAGVPLTEAARRMTLRGGSAALMIDEDELPAYRPVPGVEVSDAFAYLLLDVDTGSEFCNWRPRDVLPVLDARGRTPLTIAEGIALVTVRPDMLRPNKCFSLAGSRRGDKRVPAVWISDKEPKLGWCFEGAPHTWLGLASAGGRVAVG